MEVSVQNTSHNNNEDHDDSGFLSMDSTRRTIPLLSSSNAETPSIILTKCEDDSPPILSESFFTPNCSSAHLSPLPSKDRFKPISSTPRPPYHPVPDQIDLFSGLSQAFPHIVSKILDYLEPEELCVFSCVSHSCSRLVLDDPRSRKKRENYLKELQELKKEVGQENWPIKKIVNEDKNEARAILSEVKNTKGPPIRSGPPVNEVEPVSVAVANVQSVKSVKRRRTEPSECDTETTEAETNKRKTRNRKLEPIAGSKASKRHLKRLI